MPPRIGLDANFTIHDREDSADLMNLMRHAPGLSETPSAFRPRRPASPSTRARSTRARPRRRRSAGISLGPRRTRRALAQLFAAYVEAKQAQGVLDYDDLLLYFAQALGEPELAAEIAGRFDHLLVDEYQDTNSLQAEIALKLRPGGRGLTVVGDDAQSIYSFRAANVRNILDFPAELRSAGARGRAGAQLPLDRADPRRVERRHRAEPGAAAEDAVDRKAPAARRR